MVNKFEQLALWYLRLNGYLTVPNFVLHPNTPNSERTDADVLAVRFPHSTEVAGQKKMEPDSNLVNQPKKIDFIIAEVKSGVCRLNGPWTDEKRENMQYVIRWLGMAPQSEVPKIAEELYTNKRCEREKWDIRIVCFGKQCSKYLHGNVCQFTHEHVIGFISDRFRKHADIKSSHRQWDNFIKEFYRKAVINQMDAKQILEWLHNAV
jgi:hypothetical protein